MSHLDPSDAIKQATENNATHPLRRRFVAAGLGAICLVILAGLSVWALREPTAPADEQQNNADSYSAPKDHFIKQDSLTQRLAQRGRASRPFEADPVWTIVRPDVGYDSIRGPKGPGEVFPGDAGAEAREEPEPAEPPDPWQDPTNQRVLGPKSWMAPLPAETRQKIDQTLDAPPPPPRYPIDLDVRRESIDLARAVALECFAGNPPHGRFALEYDLVTDGHQARFLNVDFANRFQLEDPLYFECLTFELSALSFPTAEQGTMKVSYPISFEAVVLP